MTQHTSERILTLHALEVLLLCGHITSHNLDTGTIFGIPTSRALRIRKEWHPVITANGGADWQATIIAGTVDMYRKLFPEIGMVSCVILGVAVGKQYMIWRN